MAVNFQSDDWHFAKQFCDKRLVDFRRIMENPDKTYKENLIALGRILAYREFLNLPTSAFSESALTKGK